MELTFITGNKHKFKEAKEFLAKYKIKLKQKDLKCPEIRADSCERISQVSAIQCYEEIKEPLIVEDAGLFIRALNNFPGTYSAWVYKKLGNKGIINLLLSKKDRYAEFHSSITYIDERVIKTFTSICKGKISEKIRGSEKGFGFDPIFIPIGSDKTFSEDYVYKKKVSHRIKSLEKLVKYLR